MRPIRVTLECGRPNSNTREWFSTTFVLTEEEIGNGDHITIARYRARIQGYVEPFEVFQPNLARVAPSPDGADQAGVSTPELVAASPTAGLQRAEDQSDVSPAPGAAWRARSARR